MPHSWIEAEFRGGKKLRKKKERRRRRRWESDVPRVMSESEHLCH